MTFTLRKKTDILKYMLKKKTLKNLIFLMGKFQGF